MAQKETPFGEELKKLRKDANYTQSKLAGLAGISVAYISLLENGAKKPTDKVITKLSGPLGIPENHLFSKIGKVKMDFAATFSVERKEANSIITSLSDEQWEELKTFLAYIKVKAAITK